MASGDASFTAPFQLVAQRNDHIHALVAYFDVSFTMCHKKMGFSTGSHFSCNAFFLLIIRVPETTCKYVDAIFFVVAWNSHYNHNMYNAGPKSRATHWKQTVLYLEDVLTICEGEIITGSMTIAQNKKNPRDVDIKLSYSLNGQHCKISRTQLYKMR